MIFPRSRFCSPSIPVICGATEIPSSRQTFTRLMGRFTRTRVRIHDSIREVLEADMAETPGIPISPEEITFGPFEIKTFILPLKTEETK